MYFVYHLKMNCSCQTADSDGMKPVETFFYKQKTQSSPERNTSGENHFLEYFTEL